MSGPVFGVGAAGQLQRDYQQQLEALDNARWLELQVPHGGAGEPGGADYYPQEYVPQDPAAWNGDPGIWVEPPPEWGGDPGIYVRPDTGFGGDPGIYAEPPAVQEPAPRGRVLAPSIVPGLDAITGGPLREFGGSEPAAPPTDAPDKEMKPIDHMIAGANGFWLPSIVGGALSGILAAGIASRSGGSGLAAFGNRMLHSVIVGGITGAGAGLLVSATNPGEGDNLAARYAVAGGIVGAAMGGAFPIGSNRVIGAVGAGISGAIIAGITGSRIGEKS